MHKQKKALFIAAGFMGAMALAQPETASYKVWLQYQKADSVQLAELEQTVQAVYAPGGQAVVQNARQELQRAMRSITGRDVPQTKNSEAEGTLLVGQMNDLSAQLPDGLNEKLEVLGPEGFVIQSLEGKRTLITSAGEHGVLYGIFHFLRLVQTGHSIKGLSIEQNPDFQLRLLNHWDNMDGSIERGYAGRSLWPFAKWNGELPEEWKLRIEDYARDCASIGINGAVLNNVNADPRILREDYLVKVRQVADILRRWGIQVFLTPNFASPLPPSETPDKWKAWGGIGNLDTADPLDPAVHAWWKDKAAEVYQLIPDFGGFLVKANSEGMPGPADYNRTHADGAGMLARALKPHGGIVMWRAFVHTKDGDRSRQAYDEFKPLDGGFDDNAYLQIKNGPIDFQCREPIPPLFGAMPKTRLALELQITKEYLGQNKTMTYLGPMWQAILNADTYAEGKGSTVVRVVDGSLYNRGNGVIAGVANVGDDNNWCGNDFNQANWYAYGRLAWDSDLSAEAIAREWVKMTFNTDADTLDAMVCMMLDSYSRTVNYTSPLGLSHIMQTGRHLLPDPKIRKEYHGADRSGIGIDRSPNGSGYALQYNSPLKEMYSDPATTPLHELLWFHHLPWTDELSTGRTVWQELQFRYNKGVEDTAALIEQWKALDGRIDAQRYNAILTQLQQELKLAQTWRDTCLDYFDKQRKGE